MSKNKADNSRKNLIYYSIAIIMVLGTGLFKFVLPEVDSIIKQKKSITELETKIAEYQSQIKPDVPEPPKQIERNLPVKIYDPPYKGLDPENAGVDLVNQFVEKVKNTNNRIAEISFAAKTDDPNVPASILTLNVTLNGSYMSLQSLVQNIFLWKYLAAIKTISLTPDTTDPNSLVIKFTVDLYLNKG